MGYEPPMRDQGDVRILSFGEIYEMASSKYDGGVSALDEHIKKLIGRDPNEGQQRYVLEIVKGSHTIR
jgi:hypothetical protein